MERWVIGVIIAAVIAVVILVIGLGVGLGTKKTAETAPKTIIGVTPNGNPIAVNTPDAGTPAASGAPAAGASTDPNHIAWHVGPTTQIFVGEKMDGVRGPGIPSVGCFSEDGYQCNRDVAHADTILPTLTDQTHTLWCGDAHKAIHGYTGYDTPGHWCNTAM